LIRAGQEIATPILAQDRHHPFPAVEYRATFQLDYRLELNAWID
jgi:hypothetical protein